MSINKNIQFTPVTDMSLLGRFQSTHLLVRKPLSCMALSLQLQKSDKWFKSDSFIEDEYSQKVSNTIGMCRVSVKCPSIVDNVASDYRCAKHFIDMQVLIID